MGTTRREGVLAQAKLLIGEQLKHHPQSLIVVLGPTASGKTALSLNLALEFAGEIISADSRLVYRHMNIGTAKPSNKEREVVTHHLIDIVSPDQMFTLADYQSLAFAAIEQVFTDKHTPFLVGGTMLYIDSIVYNYELPSGGKESDQVVRAMSLTQLQSLLLTLNPDAPRFLDWQNPVRLMRALEFYYQTSNWIWEKQNRGRCKYPYLLLGLSVPKELLQQRIATRVEQQLKQGLVAEVEQILTNYPQSKIAITGIGYRQVKSYLDGLCSYEDMKHQIIKDTCTYAKRQMTWWRRNKEINWLEAD